MVMTGAVEDGGAFAKQAAVARQMGSEFVACVLEASLRQIGHAPRTAQMIGAWDGDRAADALALRFTGALHALARRQATPALAALYRDLDGDYDAVIAEVLAREDAFIADWIRKPPQTNEVGRSAAIWAALAETAQRFDHPMDLLELGSSAGLNLNLAHYGYDLGGVGGGDRDSPVLLRPTWRGAPPLSAKVDVRSARGVDIDPLDIRDPGARERLMAFVWPDDHARAERLAAAIDIAKAHPVRVDRADAADWIAVRLAEPQDMGTTRVVFHSIVLQYLPPDRRATVRDAIRLAGQQATFDRPLAWIAFEWDPARARAALALTTWPGERTRELATCQAHAAWIEWRGAD